ncbi:MAG: transcription elongation factor GreA [Eubacteriales bacterium]|nr:transcription elongation factor GreA [Eubacteriales bacterium]MDY4898361.1 transcription elongation factor GreA [Eubacteriales bacterium]
MSKKAVLYTQEGYDKLVEELNYLKNVRREEIKEDIAVARSFGDLSENAEYDEARNEQAKTEARIKELEEMIVNAVIADETNMDASVISMGSTVKVFDEDFNEDVEYQIVGSNEADPLLGKISDMSPIGKALVGKKAGEEVTFETPGGVAKLKILDVTRSHNNG